MPFELILSGYVVLTLIDLAYAWRQYDEDEFINFGSPKKSFMSYFVNNNVWSVGTILVLTFLISLLVAFPQ